MAAAAPGPLAERNEIHKSCKTLESVVNVLNDYCEAANAIVSLQKKLAKALREAATAKCVVDIPGMCVRPLRVASVCEWALSAFAHSAGIYVERVSSADVWFS